VIRTTILALLALTAFAGNSLLCRLALAGGTIDPASFTSVRLATGAASLALLVRLRPGSPGGATPSWRGAGYLFLYALPFSLAYRYLQAGTGALLLFGAVQVTMFLGSILEGRRPSPGQWAGLAIAFGGLAYLVSPGLSAPPPAGAGLMLLAGLGWGIYSLRGRGVADPLAQTASNFARTVPMTLLASLASFQGNHLSTSGVLLAAVSGGLASGLGYVLWYQALAGLSAVTASVIQLAVPVLAAAGGIALLGEALTWRLGIASAMVLGGIGLALGSVARRAVGERGAG
jgi:drug/metabolite transporter (DMT)-like permease